MTWCRDWAKSGVGCRGSGGVPSALSPRQLLEVSLAPPPFYSWERVLVNMARALIEVTPVCETADAHEEPHVLGRVATTILVHVDVHEFHFAPLQLHFLL